MVLVMTKLGMLRKLELPKIPNSKALSPKFLKKGFDPQNEYSLPYDAGTTGIAVNHDLYKGTIKGWKDLFSKAELAGKFSLLDDAHEVIGAALKSLGYSLNSKNPEELKKAKEVLLKVRAGVRSFNSETLTPLVNGEVAVAQAFVMDALQARRNTGGKIDYILPEEGGTLFIDNLAIPASAAHVEEAHALINFLLEAKVGAALGSNLFLAPANKESLALLPQGFQAANPNLFPNDSALVRFEMMQDMGEAAQLMDQIWTDLKVAQ
jgi:spermidine/putrescine transport system substrate-binding protein